MLDIPDSEARSILSEKLICADCIWGNQTILSPFTIKAGAGVTDTYGVRKNIVVELTCFYNPKTQASRYLFTVYKQNPYGLDRIYQLDIKKHKKFLKDAHAKPHEHWGNQRIPGKESWSNWSFNEALAHFCSETLIEFTPTLEQPDDKISEFKLR